MQLVCVSCQKPCEIETFLASAFLWMDECISFHVIREELIEYLSSLLLAQSSSHLLQSTALVFSALEPF